MSITFDRDYPPTAVSVVSLQEVCLISRSRKNIVPHKFHHFMPVCRTHIVTATAQKCLGCLCVIRTFQTVQLTDFNNPAIGYGFYFLLIATGERERIIEPFSADGLEKVLFPIPCGPGKVSTLSNLQPGQNTLATAATNHSFVCSLTSGVSSAPK